MNRSKFYEVEEFGTTYEVYVCEDGTFVWYCLDGHGFGSTHTKDGPAIELADGEKHWYLNGQLHREDGPAIERPNGNKEWYINGKYQDETDK